MFATSLIGTFSAAARSRSMVRLTCGASKASEFWTTMKRPRGLRLLLDRLGDLVDALGVVDRLDDDGDRQAAAGAGERGRGEDEGLDAGLAAEAALDVLLDLLLRRASRSAQSFSTQM